MTKLPIIFIHLKHKEFLDLSLKQAKISNPESDICLVGDDSNNIYDFVSHYKVSDYFKQAEEFSRYYRHWSTNGYNFELFCFQRWFVLKEFLSSENIDKCLYVDSDIMLYSDVTKDQERFSNYDFTLSTRTCGSIFFLNSLNGLDKFCQFLLNIYSKRDKYNYYKMLSHYAVRRKNNLNGGACDMTAFDLYCNGHFGEVGEVSLVKEGSVFDPNINIKDPGFEMENGYKKVIWREDGPYGFYLRTKKEVKFNSLHFQGKAKKIMDRFVSKH